MGEIEIYKDNKKQQIIQNRMKILKIMIFTEGTIIGPRSLFQQFNHATYIPIGNSVSKTKEWKQQGAEILYLTSRKKMKHIKEITQILLNGSFAAGILYYREGKEKYKDIVESIKPDVLIEDNCRSIGGKWQMSITCVEAEIKSIIKSIVVKEFQGIDHLPSELSELLKY
jgi:hypothetical protein